MKRTMLGVLGLVFAFAAPPASGQVLLDCEPVVVLRPAYRLEYRTTYETRQRNVYRKQYETYYETQRVTTHKPQTVIEEHDQEVIVHKRVPETSTRTVQRTVLKPYTAYRTVHEDHGCYEDQQVVVPGRVSYRMAWESAACVVDPLTGITTYRPGGLAWAPVQGPGRTYVQRVWKPQIVEKQIPVTAYRQETITEEIPQTTYKLVAEKQIRTVQRKVCRMVPVEQEVRVPRCRETLIPVTYTYRVPRTTLYRIPLDECGVPLTTVQSVVQPAEVVVEETWQNQGDAGQSSRMVDPGGKPELQEGEASVMTPEEQKATGREAKRPPAKDPAKDAADEELEPIKDAGDDAAKKEDAAAAAKDAAAAKTADAADDAKKKEDSDAPLIFPAPEKE